MGHDVFISHSSKDKAAADAVCAALEANGVRCWIAPRDVGLGRDWSEAIIDGIEAAKVMVLLFSQHSNNSEQVKREVSQATFGGLTVVPLRLEDVPMNKSFRYFLSTTHWMDALTPPLEKHLRDFSNRVRGMLELIGEPVRPAPDLSAPAVVTRPAAADVMPEPPAPPSPARPPISAAAPSPQAQPLKEFANTLGMKFEVCPY